MNTCDSSNVFWLCKLRPEYEWCRSRGIDLNILLLNRKSLIIHSPKSHLLAEVATILDAKIFTYDYSEQATFALYCSVVLVAKFGAALREKHRSTEPQNCRFGVSSGIIIIVISDTIMGSISTTTVFTLSTSAAAAVMRLYCFQTS